MSRRLGWVGTKVALALVAITFRQNLSRGRIVAQISTVVAKGLPTETAVFDSAGRWVTYGSRRCWIRTGRGIRPQPALSYMGWRVSIAGRRRGLVFLRSVSRLGTEIDTVDARTHALLADRTTQPIPGRGVSRTHSTFEDRGTPFVLPAVVPAC